MSITLFEAWIAVRGLTVTEVARRADINRNSVLNLIEDPSRARASTLDAISAAVPSDKHLNAEQIRALAARRVSDPDRVSEEIAEAIA